MNRLTIIGTGFVGTSIGLALKKRTGSFEIVGHDLEHTRAIEAKKLGAVDRAEWNLPAALERASMVVVATPIHAMQKLFSQMAEFVEPGCIVTDTASVKGPTLNWAEQSFAGRASFVGGNPIVVSVDEQRTPSASLFENRTYCIVAAARATTEAVDQVIRMVKVLGAEPLFIDPAEHDSHIAAVGQIPSLVAAALMTVAGKNPSWRDGQRLAGQAFGVATELSMLDPVEQRAQFEINRDALRGWIQALQDQLSDLGRLLEEDPDGLQNVLAGARDLRAAWRPGLGPQADAPAVELPRARDQFSGWFFGGLGGRGRK